MKYTLRTLLLQALLIGGLTSLAFPAKGAPAPKKKVAAKVTATCYDIRPGKGMGLVKLGMTLLQIQALQKKYKFGLKRESWNSAGYQLGPYRIGFKGKGATKKVYFVDMRFTAKNECFRIGQKTIRPKGNLYLLAARSGVCGTMQMGIGGSTMRCAKGGFSLIQSRAPGYRVFVEAVKQPKLSIKPPTICAGYLIRGGWAVTAAGTQKATWNKHATLKLKPGKTYCYRSLQLTMKTKIKQIPTMGQCEKYPRRGATIIFCNHEGLAFVFGGPTLILDHIDTYSHSILPLPTKYPPPLPKTKPKPKTQRRW